MVLLGICDASYCFVLFNFGQYTSNSNSSVLRNSLCQMFKENRFKVPKSSPRENVDNLQVYLLTTIYSP